MRHRLARVAGVAHALEPHAVLVAPEERRRSRQLAPAEQRTGDGGPAARRGLPVSGAGDVARREDAGDGRAPGAVDRAGIDAAAGQPSGRGRHADAGEDVRAGHPGAVGELEGAGQRPPHRHAQAEGHALRAMQGRQERAGARAEHARQGARRRLDHCHLDAELPGRRGDLQADQAGADHRQRAAREQRRPQSFGVEPSPQYLRLGSTSPSSPSFDSGGRS